MKEDITQRYECYSSEEYNKKSKVCLIENYTLEPNTEAILPAKLKAGVEQSGKVMMIRADPAALIDLVRGG